MIKKIILILLALSLIVSCASTETDIDAVNEDGSPVWVTDVPESRKFIYGVGSAKLSNDNNSQNSADARARADLARKLQATIQEATVNYTNDAEGSLLNAYEQLTMQMVNFTVQGIKVEQRWKAPDGTIWSLVSIEAKTLDDQYALAANDYLNQLEAKKVETDNKLADLLAELSAIEGDTTAIRDEAIRVANSQIAEYDVALNGIDAGALASAIDAYTTAMGYE